MAVAISRTDAEGLPFGGWRPQETVSREAALRAYTVNAAYAGFAEKRFGRLLPGERADFLLVDRDPLLASPADIRSTTIFGVWIGGQLVTGGGDPSKCCNSVGMTTIRSKSVPKPETEPHQSDLKQDYPKV
jgi:adenine deaminase